MLIENRWLVILGHKGLVGRSLLEFLLSKGEKVIGIDYSGSTETIKYLGSNFIEFRVDISDENQVLGVCRELNKRSIRVSGLVNLAAKNPKQSDLSYGYKISDQRVEEIYEALSSGSIGGLNVIRCMDDLLTNDCSIVLVGSDLSIVAPNQGLYCSCEVGEKQHLNCKVKPLFYSLDKAIAVALTRYLATFYLADCRKIKVNCLCLGPIEDKSNMEERFIEKLRQTIPANRLASPNDYNSAFYFLLCQSSSFHTGSVLVVDGGKTII